MSNVVDLLALCEFTPTQQARNVLRQSRVIENKDFGTKGNLLTFYSKHKYQRALLVLVETRFSITPDDVDMTIRIKKNASKNR